MNSNILEQTFPKLKCSSYQITSPKDIKYNCIAWAASNKERWWWPSIFSYWPTSFKDISIETFLEAFRYLGYEICDNHEFEQGHEKIAIYVKDSLPTHMARQLPSKRRTSKCGRLEDIAHDLESLEGDCYGKVAVIMKRFIKSTELSLGKK